MLISAGRPKVWRKRFVSPGTTNILGVNSVGLRKLKLLYRTPLNNREEASTSHNTRWSQTSQNVSWSSENDTGKLKSSKMKQNLSTLKDRGNNLVEKKKCNKRKEFLCEYSLEMWRSITAPFFNLKSLSMLAL